MQRGHTVFFENQPKIVAAATVAGPKECEGIVGEYVDLPLSDDMFGESTFERAERKMFLAAVERSIEKAGITQHEVDAILAGDLLNQIISASFTARETGMPFLGIYSACSTMSEGLLLGAVLTDGGYAENVVYPFGYGASPAPRAAIFPPPNGSTAIP